MTELPQLSNFSNSQTLCVLWTKYFDLEAMSTGYQMSGQKEKKKQCSQPRGCFFFLVVIWFEVTQLGSRLGSHSLE